MRTLDLLKAFSDDELKDIAAIISENKRAGLPRLFKELKGILYKGEEPDNEILFKKTFGAAYTKKKDYLLRNELRLLNEILYKYLAQKTALDHIDKYKRSFNYWLCNAYYERHLHTFLQSDINGFISESSLHKTVNESMTLGDSTAMLSLRSLWMIETQPKLAANIKLQMEAVDEWKLEEKRRFLYNLREIEAREAYLAKEMTNITGQAGNVPDDIRNPGETMIDLSGIVNEEPLIKYAILKKHAYQTRGGKRLEVLKETLDLVSSPEGLKVLTIKARLSTLNQLGLESILSSNYIEGDKYMEQNIKESIRNKYPISFSTVHNYMTNQINLGAFGKGIEIFEQHRVLTDASRLKYPTRLFAAYCYLYSGNDDAALKLLPKEANLSVLLQIIARFVYPISFLMRQEYALAVSEIKNLRRTVKAIKTGNFDTQLFIIDLYLRYAGAYTKEKDERNKILSGLKKEMKENHSEWLMIAAIDVQLHWLMKQLQSLPSKE